MAKIQLRRLLRNSSTEQHSVENALQLVLAYPPLYGQPGHILKQLRPTAARAGTARSSSRAGSAVADFSSDRPALLYAVAALLRSERTVHALCTEVKAVGLGQ
jgi:hypothetical protein